MTTEQLSKIVFVALMKHTTLGALASRLAANQIADDILCVEPGLDAATQARKVAERLSAELTALRNVMDEFGLTPGKFGGEDEVAWLREQLSALEALRPSAVAGTPTNRNEIRRELMAEMIAEWRLEPRRMMSFRELADMTQLCLDANDLSPLRAAPVAASAPTTMRECPECYDNGHPCIVCGGSGEVPVESPAPVSPERGWTAEQINKFISDWRWESGYGPAIFNGSIEEKVEALSHFAADLLAAAPAKEREKPVVLPMIPCPQCAGRGYFDSGSECSRCIGAGVVAAT